jgi:hypothetical protein
MKRPSAKLLQLSTQTLRTLDTAHLSAVDGGGAIKSGTRADTMNTCGCLKIKN